MEKEVTTQPSAADLIRESAFKTFLECYSPERTEKSQQELHRSTREVCNIVADVADILPGDMAEMLAIGGFKMCIDMDGRVKWKIYKSVAFDDDNVLV